MEAIITMFRSEDTMQRAVEPRPTLPGTTPPACSLPPTRAARPARSRGAFFGAGRNSRLGRWVANAVCVVVVTLSIVASAHFAVPAFEAAAINNNIGPELLASATSPPSFLVAHSGRWWLARHR